MSDQLASFLADRAALDPGEERALLESIRALDQARRLKELLIVDDLLSRALSPDRSDFANRVLKRTAMLHSQRFFVQRVQAATTGAQSRRDSGRHTSRTTRSSRRLAVRRPRSAIPWLAPFAAAAVLAIAVTLAFAFRGGASVPTVAPAIAHLTAPAMLHRDGGESAAAAGTELHDGDAVSADSETALDLADGTRLTLAPRSELRLDDRAQDGLALRLERGSLRAVVAHQPPGSALEFVTAHASARVLGTRFTLAVIDGRTRLEVEEGRVAFRDLGSGSETIVAGGAHAEAGAAAVAAEPSRTRVIDACDDPRQWFDSTNTPNSRMRHEVVAGRSGGCLRFVVQAAPKEAPWAFRWSPQRDWTGWDGLRLWVKGTGKRESYSIEIIQRLGRPDEEEHFIVELVDDSTDWKLVTLPFARFARRGYQPAAHARNDGLHVEATAALAFIFSASIDLSVDQIELYGR